MIDTLLIDADDTLLDFTLGERTALGLAFAAHSLPFASDTHRVYHAINYKWWEKFERGEVSRADLVWHRFADLLEHYQLSFDPAVLNASYEQNLVEQHELIAGAKEFLIKMRARYRLYVVSNGHVRTQTKRFAQSGLDRLADGVFISEAVGYHKPQKEFFEHVAASIPHFDKDRAVLIGDSLSSDIQGGLNYGIKTILFNREGKTIDKIRPDYVAHDWQEVETILATL